MPPMSEILPPRTVNNALVAIRRCADRLICMTMSLGRESSLVFVAAVGSGLPNKCGVHCCCEKNPDPGSAATKTKNKESLQAPLWSPGQDMNGQFYPIAGLRSRKTRGETGLDRGESSLP